MYNVSPTTKSVMKITGMITNWKKMTIIVLFSECWRIYSSGLITMWSWISVVARQFSNGRICHILCDKLVKFKLCFDKIVCSYELIKKNDNIFQIKLPLNRLEKSRIVIKIGSVRVEQEQTKDIFQCHF